MGIDEEAGRFFGADVAMLRPKPGERFVCALLEQPGLPATYIVAAGPIVILTHGEALALNAKTKQNFPAGIIDRTCVGRL